jgi:hypothetical protein
MSKDILSRMNITSKTPAFDALSSEIQKVLKRAASRGAANSTPEIFASVGRDWLMVPSKKGLRQVVVTAERAYRI